MATATPTARTLALLRRRGWIAAPVERWLAGPGVRQDVWGFGDVLAAHPRERAILLVQATTAGHLAARLAKAQARPELAAWLAAGGAVQVWGWRRCGQRWRVKVVAVRAEDLAAIVLEAPPRRRSGRPWAPLPLFDREAPAS
jgi:hypothetical protein